MTSAPTVFVDANVFLRFLVEPATEETVQHAEVARHFFLRAAKGELTFTTNSAVVAEVVFILHSPKHYARSRTETAHLITRLIGLPACELSEKRSIIEALTLWQTEAHRKLSFVDCLVVAQSASQGAKVASFDRRVQRLAGNSLWEPHDAE